MGKIVQIAPTNPVLQALAGAQNVGDVRPVTSTRVETARAVSESKKSEDKRDVENPPKEGRPHKKGRIIDMMV